MGLTCLPELVAAFRAKPGAEDSRGDGDFRATLGARGLYGFAYLLAQHDPNLNYAGRAGCVLPNAAAGILDPGALLRDRELHPATLRRPAARHPSTRSP